LLLGTGKPRKTCVEVAGSSLRHQEFKVCTAGILFWAKPRKFISNEIQDYYSFQRLHVRFRLHALLSVINNQIGVFFYVRVAVHH